LEKHEEPTGNYINQSEISDYLNTEAPSIKHTEILPILEKLVEDKYIKIDYAGLEPACKITFDGKVLNQTGGYFKENEMDKKELNVKVKI
jgi:DNA-binding Lrp family transcriptional regulator